MKGQRFGKWIILDDVPVAHRVRVLCDCGYASTVRLDSLKSGRSKSCKRCSSTKHGYSQSTTYECWEQMHTRCRNRKRRTARYYVGRGIKVCERWGRFAAFLEDMGERPEGYTLDRIDVNGDYEPSNCRWATRLEQANNTRANRYLQFQGERMSMADWARRLGMAYQTIQRRLDHGWPTEEALSKPCRRKGRTYAA